MNLTTDHPKEVDASTTESITGRQTLQNGGVVRIGREMPYIAVAFDNEHRDQEMLARLVATQSNFLLAPPDEETRFVINRFAARMTQRFGSVLILHVWIGGFASDDEDPVRPTPAFRIDAPEDDQLASTVDEFGRAFKDVILYKRAAQVSFRCIDHPGPPNLEPLELESSQWIIGVEVAPSYRNQSTGQLHPIEFENLRQQTSYAFKKGAFEFSRKRTSWQPNHYFALGRKEPGKLAVSIDQELSEIHSAFAFLLQTSPINAKEAWADFQEHNFEKEPTFHYRPLAVDPEKLKRRLFDVPIERVDDPILVRIFREKQEELDRKLTMLREIDSRAFFLGSIQLYDEVKPPLLQLARKILTQLPPDHESFDTEPTIGDEEFANLASDEFDYYREQYPAFPRHPEVRDDIPPGLMVSRGMLLIGKDTRISPNRVKALLDHEVGTHMVTYYNGCEQPLQLLHSGLAGYEALQEGIAVVGEYLAGGLTAPRMRMLAARVVAAQALIEEVSFVDLFDRLTATYNFDPHVAFTICRRTFRGGGFIKDVIYLRGLREVIDYLQNGGEFKRLFVGKLAIHHLPFIHEMEERGMLQPLPLTSRMLTRPESADRLERIRQGASILDLVNR